MSIFEKTNKALEDAIARKKQNAFESDRSTLLSAVGNDLARVLEPIIRDTLKGVIDKQVINVEPPQINIPAPVVNVSSPDVHVPEPKVTVNIPKTEYPAFPKMPPLVWPEDEMPIKGWVQLMGVNLQNPLPVQLRDANGKAVDFGANLTQVFGGGGGGKADYLTIKGYSQSAFAEIMNADGQVKVAGSFTASAPATTYVIPGNSEGIVYNGDNPLPVVFGASATQAVNMVDSSGIAYSGTNPVPVVFGASASSGVNIIDSSGIGYSGSNPVPITWISGAGPGTTAAVLVDSTGIQYEGANPLPVNLISQSLASSSSALVDSSGIQYSGSNPVPITWVSGAGSGTSAAVIVDSTGIQYAGANQFPVTVNGATNSVLATGTTLHDAADTGDAPLKIGGVAMTANPTAVVGGDRVRASFDDLGRQVIRNIQVRDLISTARITLTTGTETTLKAAVAGSFLDCVAVMCANNSDVAVSVDIRAVTAGNILQTIQVPASGTAGWAPPVPWPQDETGNNWTADLPDITGTTVTLSALFSREV